MSTRRDIRRLAMQVLYQIDLRGAADAQAIRDGLVEGIDQPEVQDVAFSLALAAWESHAAADAMAGEIAPQWPSHRQPPVDRALIRLAYHEIVSGHAPWKVAVNEAVELAKEYGSEQSPSFINGVLDKMARKITELGITCPSAPPHDPAKAADDPWLADALGENQNDETRNPNQ